VSPRLLIAQISDLHIKPPGELAYGRVDTAVALKRCVDTLNQLEPRPLLVVISGDLVEKASPKAYDHLMELLAPLEIQYAAIPGNHDDRAMLGAASFDHRSHRAVSVFSRTLDFDDAEVVLIDSTVPGADYGALDAATLAWLDTTLAASATRPALIFLHHPPFATGIAHMDRQNLRNAGDVAEILQRHPRARLIAAGHVHRAVLTTFAGVAATICPAPNHAVALDLGAGMPPGFRIEPPAFHLHAWFPGDRFGTIVTHLVPIGEFDGPYPFFDGKGNLI